MSCYFNLFYFTIVHPISLLVAFLGIKTFGTVHVKCSAAMLKIKYVTQVTYLKFYFYHFPDEPSIDLR